MSLPIIEQQLFRRVCGKFATGITILTLCDAAGAPHGMTVNSFTSVSLDPPLILVCIDLKARLLNQFITGARFAVNILHEEQKDLSATFARDCDRFEAVDWDTGKSGAPIFPGVLATLECAVTQIVQAGDHVVVVGNVSHATWREGLPLIYFNSSYRALRPDTSAS